MSSIAQIIGLTGNIGSGKSTVAAFFKANGLPVFDADQTGRVILTNSKLIVKKITDEFGSDVLNELGSINRQKLASLVFDSPEQLAKLNSIIHPEVKRVFENWIKAQQHKFVIRESAILFETGIYKESYKNILVTCPLELRIERVMKRNKISREDVLTRENNQWKEELKIDKTDFIIENSDRPISPQIFKILQSLNSN